MKLQAKIPIFLAILFLMISTYCISELITKNEEIAELKEDLDYLEENKIRNESYIEKLSQEPETLAIQLRECQAQLLRCERSNQ